MFFISLLQQQLWYLNTSFSFCQQLFYLFLKIFLKSTFYEKERRKRDLNPRAATNDLLPFQGSPFSHLGTSPSKSLQVIHYSKRRRWDSNPRSLSESPVFKTGSLNHSDTSPKQLSDSFIITRRLAFVKYFFNFFSNLFWRFSFR